MSVTRLAWRLANSIALLAISLIAAPLHAQTNFYDCFWNAYHSQPTPAAPSAPFAHQFAARVVALDASLLTQATVTLPGGAPTQTLSDLGNGYYLWQSATFAAESELLTSFPAGIYTHSISGGDLGDQSATLERPETDLYTSTIPAFTEDSWNSMQHVDAGMDFDLSFNSFLPGAGSNLGLTFVTLYDPDGHVVFNELYPNETTSTIIPANTLLPGRAYTAVLFFSSRIELPGGLTNSTSIVGFDRVTAAPLTTIAICAADFNADTGVDFFDYLDFVAAFSSNDPAADFNADTVIDFFDYLDFVASFSTGC